MEGLPLGLNYTFGWIEALAARVKRFFQEQTQRPQRGLLPGTEALQQAR